MFIKKIIKKITPDNATRTLRYLRKNGIIKTYHRVIEATLRSDEEDYYNWIANHEPKDRELSLQRNKLFSNNPKISIVVPTYNTPKNFLTPMIESVQSQTYKNWELCIADGSTEEDSRERIAQLYRLDKRIRTKRLKKNLGIAGNTNAAINMAAGDYIIFLDHDDTLAHFALYEIVLSINEHPEADFLYSDEDKLSSDGKTRARPHFKPDWSPETLRSYNYITHLLILKTSLVKKIGMIRSGFEGAQDFDLVLRASEVAKQIVHIPKILYHWREHQNSTSLNTGSKSYVTYSTQKAVADSLERSNIKGRVFGGSFFGSARIIYDLKSKPLISIIIPTKDHVEILRTCINSIINRTSYSNYEIIVIDNHSQEKKTFDYYKELEKIPKVKRLTWNRPFNFSAINNYAASKARGDYFLFLNNDTEVHTAEWIDSLLEFCQQNSIGAVGAKLLYPDLTIQHAGVTLGIGGIAGHPHKSFPGHHDGYYGRLSVPVNLSAVTAACIMIPKDVFNKVGGFDEGYPLAFNDVDLCLKIGKEGYRIVCTPYAQLIHHESKTRGYEDTPDKQRRFKAEIDRFIKKWEEDLDNGDPYYNINLTLEREDYSIKLEKSESSKTN